MTSFPPSKSVDKVIINVCYGGWGVSDEGVLEFAKRSGFKLWTMDSGYGDTNFYMKDPEGLTDEEQNDEFFWSGDIDRTDPILVAMVEEDPGKWDGKFSELQVVELPVGLDYEIDDYDGIETIHETHRSWP